MKLKMFRKFICVVLSTAVLLASVPFVFAEDAASGTDYNNTAITWSYDSSSNTLTLSGTGAIHDYKGSSSYDDLYTNRPWQSYAATAKKIVIGEGITRVGNQAFNAFKLVEAIELPQTLTSIGQYAFYTIAQNYSCIVNIPSSVTKIESNAFYTSSNTNNLWINFEKRADAITISPTAFRECGESKYITWLCAENPSQDLLDTLNTLNPGRLITYSFDETSKTLSVWSKNGEFGEWQSGSNTSANLAKSFRPWYNDNTKTASNIVFEAGVTKLGKNSFSGYTQVVDIKLPDTLTQIGEYALYQHCAKYLSIPSTVTSIGSQALFCSSKLGSTTNKDFVMVISSPSITIAANMLNDGNVSTTIYCLPDSGVQTYAEGRSTVTYPPKTAELKSGITVLADSGKAIVYNSGTDNVSNSSLLFASYSDADKTGLKDAAVLSDYCLGAGNAEIVTVPETLDIADAQAKKIFWINSLSDLVPLCNSAEY